MSPYEVFTPVAGSPIRVEALAALDRALTRTFALWLIDHTTLRDCRTLSEELSHEAYLGVQTVLANLDRHYYPRTS